MQKSVMVFSGSVSPPHPAGPLDGLGIQVLAAVGEALGADWDYELCSPFWRFYLHRTAGAEILLKGGALALLPGVPYLLPAGLRFHTRIRPGVAQVWQDYIHFEVTGVAPGLLRRLFPGPVALGGDRRVAELARAWSRSRDSEAGRVSAQLRAGALVHAALAAALDALGAARRAELLAWREPPALIAPALSVLQSCEGRPPSNAELAERCGLGLRQFLRRFRMATGSTPAQVALDRRMALAAEALARSDEPVDGIAGRLGFSDRFHFSRAFRQRVGQPPARYRSLHGGRG